MRSPLSSAKMLMFIVVIYIKQHTWRYTYCLMLIKDVSSSKGFTGSLDMHCKRLEIQAGLGKLLKKSLIVHFSITFCKKQANKQKTAKHHALSSQVYHKKPMLSNLWNVRTSHLLHLPCWLTFSSLKFACYHIRRSQLSLRSRCKNVPNYSVQIQGGLYTPWRTSPRDMDSTPSTYGANTPASFGLELAISTFQAKFLRANYLGKQPPKRLWKKKKYAQMPSTLF